MSNSAKYTQGKGDIWVTASLGENGSADDGFVTVTVADSGIGIPTEALPHVFDMFSQVDRSLERVRGGLGIGLALVKQLVETHGGTVRAESPGLGKGSTFTVRLPLAPPAVESAFLAAQSGAQPVAPAAVQVRKVLVADDNDDAATALTDLLTMMGHEVHIANDGMEAVDAADRFRPDIILMDVGMPKLDGWNATRRIREQPWSERTTIVALTGWSQQGDKEKSRHAGCDAHLVKPIDLDQLEQLLKAPPR